MVRRLSSVLALVGLLLGVLVAVGSGPAVAAPAVSALPGGTYVPATPSRLLDTRSGLGAPRGLTSSVLLAVAGRGGVPAAGVSAVVLNVTVTGAGGAGWLAVSPSGTSTSSNVNFVVGRTVAQLVTSTLSADGGVVLNASARVHMVADLVGWFTDSPHADAGATYRPSTPRRLFDSRAAGAGGPLVGGGVRRIALSDVPAGATAVAVDLTTVRPDRDVYLTAWGSGARPGTSSMNVSRGDVRSNRAIVPLGSDRRSITVSLDAGRADLIVDLSGWFTAGAGAAGGSRFVPLAPARVGDTRQPWSVSGPLYRNEYAPLFTTIAVAGRRPGDLAITLPPADALVRPTAAWLSVTVVSPRSTGWLALAPTVGNPDDPQRTPGSADVNFGAGVTPNAVLATLGDGGMTSTTSSMFSGPGGSADPDLVVDIAGIFVATPQPAVGLWHQGGDSTDADRGWNHPVGAASGDIVEVAGSWDGNTVALRRDGTVLQWTSQQQGSSVLATDGVHVTASGYGIYVVRTDGTVWTDDLATGMHGVPGNVSDFGPVAGLTGVATVAVGYGGAQAVRTDGTVVAWGGSVAPRPADVSMRSPVRSVAMMSYLGTRECASYEDGSFDIRRRPDSPWHVVRAGIGPLTLAPADRGGCYGLDAAGRVHHLTVNADDTDVVDEILPGLTARALAAGLVRVRNFAGNYVPDVRVLTTDGEVWDRTGSYTDLAWTRVDGLDGATAVGGGGAFVTWVPPVG